VGEATPRFVLGQICTSSAGLDGIAAATTISFSTAYSTFVDKLDRDKSNTGVDIS
jgi:hypothetical protein